MDRRGAQAAGDAADRGLLRLRRRCSRCSAERSAGMAASSGRWSPSARWWCCLALGLAVENLAARDNALVPMIWLQAVAPGVICGWLLLGTAMARRRGRQPAEADLSGMTPPITLVDLHRPAVHRLGDRHAARAVRSGRAVRLHRTAAPLASKPDATFAPGGRDRRAAPALHRDADAAVRGPARRHAVLLAPDPFVRADRRARRRRFRLGVPHRSHALRAGCSACSPRPR